MNDPSIIIRRHLRGRRPDLNDAAFDETEQKIRHNLIAFARQRRRIREQRAETRELQHYTPA